MNLNYHKGHLRDHFNSNIKRGQIEFHLSQIWHKYESGEIKIDNSDFKIFKKIISRMMKYNHGYWNKENWEYKILYYSLFGLIEN